MGAVNALVVCNICMFPTSTVLIYGIVPVPAAVVGLLFVGSDFFGLMQGVGSRTGYAAHLGGALTGALAFWALKTGRWPRMLLR